MVLDFFLEKHSLAAIGDAYLLFVNDTLKETKYFTETGHYRYNSFAEVAKQVYYRKEYMEQYMIGVQLSGYIWEAHLNIHRWFRKKLESFAGDDYLEIGPGHGQYFLEAVNMQKFSHYFCIDVSETSLNLTRDWCQRFKKDGVDNYEIILGNLLEYPFAGKFDGVCMSEVLEHLENPREYLNRIYEITNKGANIYIVVPVNAPTIDHIYLFRSIEEVFEMVTDAGFAVVDSICATANNILYEKAVKKNRAINLAVHMTK